MAGYRYEVNFFLSKEENEVFLEYCKHKGSYPYMVGKLMVQEFLMTDEANIEQMIIKDDYEVRVGSIESRVEAYVYALKIHNDKIERLENEIEYLEGEVEKLAGLTLHDTVASCVHCGAEHHKLFGCKQDS